MLPHEEKIRQRRQYEKQKKTSLFTKISLGAKVVAAVGGLYALSVFADYFMANSYINNIAEEVSTTVVYRSSKRGKVYFSHNILTVRSKETEFSFISTSGSLDPRDTFNVTVTPLYGTVLHLHYYKNGNLENITPEPVIYGPMIFLLIFIFGTSVATLLIKPGELCVQMGIFNFALVIIEACLIAYNLNFKN